MGAYDSERTNPLHYSISHNSVSPEGDDIRKWSDDDWRKWMSDTGQTRGYAGYTHSYHYYQGTETFTQAPYVAVPNGDGIDIYSDTWRVVTLVDDPKGYVCWHAGNWDINCDSVGYEAYGRYDNKEFPDNAVKAIADHIRTNIDLWNNAITQLRGHKEVSQIPTGCPNRVMDKMGLLTDCINNPGKYSTLNQPKDMVHFKIYWKNPDGTFATLYDGQDKDDVSNPLWNYIKDAINYGYIEEQREVDGKVVESVVLDVNKIKNDYEKQIVSLNDQMTQATTEFNTQLKVKDIQIAKLNQELSQKPTTQVVYVNVSIIDQIITFINNLFKRGGVSK